jgi:hypothetical protein
MFNGIIDFEIKVQKITTVKQTIMELAREENMRFPTLYK